MTSQKPGTPHSVDSDSPDTEVIAVSSPASVFVDSTGRRRRLLRRLSYVFGGLCMVYGGLVSVSLAGGPVSSSAVLPLPDLRHDDTEEAAAGPRPAPIPVPSASTTRPLESYVADVVPRRRTTATVTRIAAPRPPAPQPSAKPSPSAAPSSAKPVESTTKPSTAAPSATTTVPELPIKTPPVPVPPAPPVPQSSTGGSGGGGEAPDEGQDETVAAPTAEPKAQETTDSADTPEPSVSAEQPA